MASEPVCVYIGAASDIEAEANLTAALRLLCERVTVEAVATVYCTPPLGGREQPPYLNSVWLARSALGPRQIKFGVLREIEAALGRVRKADAYAARRIDLDLLLWDDEVIDEPGLVLPDPDVRTRRFVAEGILEIDADIVLPDTGERLSGIAGALPAGEMTREEGFTQDLRARWMQWTSGR